MSKNYATPGIYYESGRPRATIESTYKWVFVDQQVDLSIFFSWQKLLPSVYGLQFVRCAIENPQLIKDFPKLTDLIFEDCSLPDWDFLYQYNYPTLETLNISGNHIRHFLGLSGAAFPNLFYLNIGNNPLESFAFPNLPPRLKHLNLSNLPPDVQANMVAALTPHNKTISCNSYF